MNSDKSTASLIEIQQRKQRCTRESDYNLFFQVDPKFYAVA